jgi:hypothetical protein
LIRRVVRVAVRRGGTLRVVVNGKPLAYMLTVEGLTSPRASLGQYSKI